MNSISYVIQWKKNRQGRWTEFKRDETTDFEDINLALSHLEDERENYPASIFRIRKRQQPKTKNA